MLLDDNFATIVAAVEEGRVIYDNVRKFIKYILAGNVGELGVMLLAPVVGMPLPLLPLQILWINLVTDGLPALALGVEPAEREAMRWAPAARRQGGGAGAKRSMTAWAAKMGRNAGIGRSSISGSTARACSRSTASGTDPPISWWSSATTRSTSSSLIGGAVRETGRAIVFSLLPPPLHEGGQRWVGDSSMQSSPCYYSTSRAPLPPARTLSAEKYYVAVLNHPSSSTNAAKSWASASGACATWSVAIARRKPATSNCSTTARRRSSTGKRWW